jgi:hypothetical protein
MSSPAARLPCFAPLLTLNLITLITLLILGGDGRDAFGIETTIGF